MKLLFGSTIILLCILCINHTKAQNTWESVGPANIAIHSFGVDTPFLFASGNCDDGGIFLTTDYGDNWTQVNAGLPGDGTPIKDIAISDTSILAAVTYRGMYISKDSANHWTHINGANAIYSIVFADAPWNAIWAAGSKTKGIPSVIRSDKGTSWTDISHGLPLAGSMYSIIARDSALFVSTFYGVYKLNYGSEEWEPSISGINNSYVYSLGQNEVYLFAATAANGVFRSEDGSDWIQKNSGLELENTSFNAFAFYESTVFTAATGSHGGVYQSSDNGDHWHEINTGFPLATNVNSLAINGAYIYAGTDDNGVFTRKLSELTATAEISDGRTNDGKIKISPNPGSGKFSITFSSNTNGAIDKIVEINCYTLPGNLIFSKKYSIQSGELIADFDLSYLPNGMYLVQIHHQDLSVSSKLIINK